MDSIQQWEFLIQRHHEWSPRSKLRSLIFYFHHAFQTINYNFGWNSCIGSHLVPCGSLDHSMLAPYNYSICQARELARQTARFPSATRRLSGGPDTSADSYHQSPAASGVRYRSSDSYHHQSPAAAGGQRGVTVSSPYMVMDEVEAKASPRLYQYQGCVYVML